MNVIIELYTRVYIKESESLNEKIKHKIKTMCDDFGIKTIFVSTNYSYKNCLHVVLNEEGKQKFSDIVTFGSHDDDRKITKYFQKLLSKYQKNQQISDFKC